MREVIKNHEGQITKEKKRIILIWRLPEAMIGSLKEEIKNVFEEWYREVHPSRMLYGYVDKHLAIEKKYVRGGMKLEDIQKIRREIANDR